MQQKLILSLLLLILLINSQSASAFLPLQPNNLVITYANPSNVIDIYDQNVTDYSTPTSSYASSSSGTSPPLNIDTSSNKTGNGAVSSDTLSITVGNHANRLLLAMISESDSSDLPPYVKSIKIGSTGFTRSTNATAGLGLGAIFEVG